MIRRIRPVIRVKRIESEIRRLMDTMLSGRSEWPDLEGGWIPLVDIYESGEDLAVEAEVPGLTARDLVVSLHPSRIEIKGVKQEVAAAAGARYVRLERGFGTFQRTIPLPCAVRPERATAVLENGILTVRMKKWKEPKSRDIVVKILKSQE